MSVVNVKVKSIRPKYENLSEWMKDENNVYIGRAGIVFIEKVRFPKIKSEWANPFKVKKEGREGKDGRENCLIEYEEYIRGKIKKEGIEELKKLKGKVLGCWCKPEKCHGDILLKLIEELIE